MYGKVVNGKVVYAPDNYKLSDGTLIIGFNTNEELMMKYGFKEIVEYKVDYDPNTEELYINNVKETINLIEVYYSSRKKNTSVSGGSGSCNCDTYNRETIDGFINHLQATKADIGDLTAINANITNLQADTANINNAIINKANITDLTAANAEIDNLKANKADIEYLDANYATINLLNSNVANINTAIIDKANISDLNATNAVIEDLKAGKADIGDLNAVNAKITNLEASKADIEILESKYATIEQLDATNANITNLQADTANINKALIDKADISDLNATNANITNLQATKANISDLNATNANINTLTTNLADINTLVNGNLTSDNIQSMVITGDKFTVADAFIKNAMIDSINASKINAGIINTNNVSIQSNDGSMLLQGNLQQFKDKNGKVRIQIGKDASGNFTFCLYDENGTGQLINQNGIQSSNAIADGLIVDSKVADNANIAGSKLDIDSVVTEINDGSTSIKGTKIYLDEQKQALNVAFNNMTTTVKGNTDTIKTHTTSINTMNGKVTKLISDTTITKQDGTTTSLKDAYNATVDTVNSHSTKIGSLETNLTTANNNISSVSSKQSALEQNLNGFKQTVSNTYTTKADFNGLTIGGTNLLKDSKKEHTNNDYCVAQYYPSSPLVQGEQYTISLCVTPAKGVTRFNAFLSQGYRNNADLYVSGTNKQTIIKTFTAYYYEGRDPSVNYANAAIHIYRIPDDGTVTNNSTIHWIKIEKGNKATDWTPAPQDIDASITAVDNKFVNYSTTSQMNSAITQKANEITSTVSETYATKASLTTVDNKFADYSTTSAVHSAINQKANEITSSVSQTYATKTSLKATDDKFANYSTTSAMNSAINQKADSILSTVSNTYTTKSDFNNLTMGGRNLFLGTKGFTGTAWSGTSTTNYTDSTTGYVYRKIWSSTSDSWTKYIRQYINIEANTDYIMSALVRKNTDEDVMIAWRFDYSDMVDRVATVTSKNWTRITFPVRKIEVNSIDESTVLFVPPNSTCISESTAVDIAFIKFEKGNKATDWSPAPEDIDSSIATVDNKFIDYSTTQQMNSAINQKANEITSTVSETYATKTALTTVDNKFANYSTTSAMNSAINQKADSILSTVNNTYATKESLNSVDGKFANYSTTSDMHSAINQKSDAILSTVSKTYATQTSLTDVSNNLKNNYSTTSAMNSAINQKANEITSSVSETYATKTSVSDVSNNLKNNYSTTSAMNSAINQKANEITSTVSETYATKTALNTVDGKFANYSTTSAMNSAINQKSDAILSTVSGTYATKTALNTVDGKFANYSTTTAMNSAINQKANEITSSVSSTYTTKTDFNNLTIGGTNLITNSCFAGGSTTGWGTNESSTCSVTVINETSSPTGKALKLAVTSTASGRGVYNSVTPKSTGEYTLSFYGKSDTAGYKIYIIWEGCGSKDIELTTSWQKYTLTMNRTELNRNAIAVYTRPNSANGNFYVHSFKLEKGNKATSWSPAPEDVNNAISAVDGKFASYSTTAQMNSAISLKANEITQAVSNTYTTKAQFNALDVGGRNLYTGTKDWSGTWAKKDSYTILDTRVYNCVVARRVGSWYGIMKQIAIEPNTDYTLSGWIKGSGGATINAYCDNCLIKNRNFTQNEVLSTEWKRYWFTFNSQAVTINEARFENSVEGATIEICGLKLEKGNKATDWSPAPEDIDSSIATVDGKFASYSTTQQMNSAISTKANEITTSVSNTYATKSSLSTTNSNVSSLTTRMSNAESKLTKDSLTTTIGNYYTTSNDVNGLITAKGYATTSQVSQTATDLTAKFSSSGGYNLLRNSVFTRSGDFWDLQGSTIDTGRTFNGHNSIKITSSGATSDVWKGIQQRFAENIPKGKTYTASLWYYVENKSTFDSNFVLELKGKKTGATSETAIAAARVGTSNLVQGAWTKLTVTVTTKESWEYLHIYPWVQKNGAIWITELQVEEGSLATLWTPHPYETYDGITQINKDGIKVYHTSIDSNSYTHMSPSGFYLKNKGTDIFKVDSNGLYLKGNADITGTITGSVISGGTISGTEVIGGSFSVEGLLTANKIVCKDIDSPKYPGVVTEDLKLYVSTSGSDDSELEDGATFASFDGLLDKLPKNLNGHEVRIEMSTDIAENVEFVGYHGGRIKVHMKGHTLNGYVSSRMSSARIFFYSGYIGNSTDTSNGRGKIHPNKGYAVGNYTTSVACEESGSISLYNIDDYGADNYLSGSSNKVGAVAATWGTIYISNVKYYGCDIGARANAGGRVHDAESYGVCAKYGCQSSTGGYITLSKDPHAGGKTANYIESNAGKVIVASGATFATGDATTSGGKAPVSSSKTVTIKSTSGDTYRSTVYNKYKGDNTVRQGNYGYGNCNGIWLFGDQFDQFKGKNITKVVITINRQDGGQYASVDLNIKTHNYKTRPSGNPSYVGNVGTLGLAVNTSGSKTITDTNNTIIAGLRNGTIKGIGLQSTYDSGHYAVCSGSVTIKVTYSE